MDYQALLTKYMRYVCDVEGTTFAYHYAGMSGDQKFTPEEWEAIRRIHFEVTGEDD